MARYKSEVRKIERNYAFLKKPDGYNRDVYLSNKDFRQWNLLKEGMILEYDIEETDRGLSAKKVKIIPSIENIKVIHVNSNGDGRAKPFISSEEVDIELDNIDSPYCNILKEKMIFEMIDKKLWLIKDDEKGNPVSNEPYLDKICPPYNFVPVNQDNNKVFALSDFPVYHACNEKETYSGELLCTLTAITPLLVGNDQYQAQELSEVISNKDGAKLYQKQVDGKNVNRVKLPDKWNIHTTDDIDAEKSILEPLSISDNLIIPGSGIKGMLRKSISAILDAPMERVWERTYSYRPNLHIKKYPESKFVCYPAIVRKLNANTFKVDVLNGMKPSDVGYRSTDSAGRLSFSYSHGIDGERELFRLHKLKEKNPRDRGVPSHKTNVYVKEGFLHPENDWLDVPTHIVKHYYDTHKHLKDEDKNASGHLSSHPLVGKENRSDIINRIKKAEFLQEGQLIYVEVEEENRKVKRITSIGRHFRYRWRYTDTVRTRWNWDDKEKRNIPQTRLILKPIAEEKGEKPKYLSGGRLFFGYVDGQGTEGIGKDNFSRLAGRIAINMAVEVSQKNGQQRFLNEKKGCVVALKELGQPRPSAVEFYLQQNGRRNDRGSLTTYGDTLVEKSGKIVNDDDPGELNGRKFYLHNPKACTDSSYYETNDDKTKASKQAMLARFVSAPGNQFRFTLRFRNLRAWELGLLISVLESKRMLQHLKNLATSDKKELKGYLDYLISQKLVEGQLVELQPILAHKLGHGRPLGMGSVSIQIGDKGSCWSADGSDKNFSETLKTAQEAWLKKHQEWLKNQPKSLEAFTSWLAVHQFRGQLPSEYPQHKGEIFEFHTALRQRHAKNRQFQPGNPTRRETLVLPKLEPKK